MRELKTEEHETITGGNWIKEQAGKLFVKVVEKGLEKGFKKASDEDNGG